jgi:hypothetical protein
VFVIYFPFFFPPGGGFYQIDRKRDKNIEAGDICQSWDR